MANKLYIYGEERQHWVYEFKQKIKAAVELDELLRERPLRAEEEKKK